MAFSFADYNNEREFIQAEEEFTILPDGEYQLILDGVEWRETNKGDGRYLACKWSVVSPDQYQGATVYDNLNLENPSDQAVNIAKRRLKSIEDCGQREFFAEDDMPGTTLNARIVQESYVGRDGAAKVSNRIKAYKPNDSGAVHVSKEQSTPAQAPRQTAPAPQAKPAPSNGKLQPAGVGGGSEAAKPWMRK